MTWGPIRPVNARWDRELKAAIRADPSYPIGAVG